jgi:hypothetical protein
MLLSGVISSKNGVPGVDSVRRSRDRNIILYLSRNAALSEPGTTFDRGCVMV